MGQYFFATWVANLVLEFVLPAVKANIQEVYVYTFVFTHLLAWAMPLWYFFMYRGKRGMSIATGVIASLHLLAVSGMTTIPTKNGYIFPHLVPWGDYFSPMMNVFIIHEWVIILLCASVLIDLAAKSVARIRGTL